MTRSERVRAACERFAEGPPDQESVETVDEGVEAALDAALADLGGLDGLDALRADFGRALNVNHGLQDVLFGLQDVLFEKARALRADRDRLRGALRKIADASHSIPTADEAWLIVRLRVVRHVAQAAIRASATVDSEAGT